MATVKLICKKAIKKGTTYPIAKTACEPSGLINEAIKEKIIGNEQAEKEKIMNNLDSFKISFKKDPFLIDLF